VGTHTVTARVTDSKGATSEAQINVSIEAPAAPAGGFVVTATAYKVRGWQNVDLTWSGAASTAVDVYRDGMRITTTPNTGRYTDAINRKGPRGLLVRAVRSWHRELLECEGGHVLKENGSPDPNPTSQIRC
jgi:hypothetical protein